MSKRSINLLRRAMSIPMEAKVKTLDVSSGLTLNNAAVQSVSETPLANAANNTTAVSYAVTDNGKTCFIDTASVAKTLTLPANVTAADIGTSIQFVQAADLVGSGVLTISAGAGNTFATNSYALGYNSSRYLTPTYPAAANNTITITGAATNSAWGIGSLVTFVCVAAGEWQFELKSQPLGTGNAAIAYSTA